MSGSPDAAEPAKLGNPYLAALVAWLVPGGGHLYLGKWRRALAFLVLVLAALAVGVSLEGRLPWHFSGAPLDILKTLGCLGSGLPYLCLHYLVGYQGTVAAAGYEYGSAFIVTAGVMNLLLVLDSWDIAEGQKD
ncbi:MAG: DUF6677 family protein [Acidobacteriota bacterium]